MPEDPNKRHFMLEAGGLVILHPDGPADGFPMVVSVDQVVDDQCWFLACCEPIARGETLIVEYPIQEDARYVTRARVVASSPETFALELDAVWERVQQRAFVRILVHGLQVRVLRPTRRLDGPEEATPDCVHDLLDISAGGIGFSSAADYEVDEELVCHFELPGALCFVLPGRIVRAGDPLPSRPGKSSVAVEFLGLDETNRSQLLRWIYREQVRRHREEARQDTRD